jgi:hypothetical protein
LLSLDEQGVWQEALEHIYRTRKEACWDPSPVLERAGRFTWEKAAEKTMDLYEEVYRGC